MSFNEEKYLRSFYFDKTIDYQIVRNDVVVDVIKIQPVKVSEYIDFHMCIDILLIEKNRIPSVEIIKMSYKDYVVNLIDQEEKKIKETPNADIKLEMYMNYIKFSTIIKLCLGIEHKDISWKKSPDNKNKLYLKDTEINAKEFEEIRKIICSQNMIELPDERIDPALKKVLDDALKFKNRNEAKMGSLEDQMICIMSEYHYRIEDIEKLSLRKFQKMLERADLKLHYKIYKSAECNGTQFKEGINHWMSEIIHNKYADVIVSYSEVKSKFEGKPSAK